MTATKSGPSAPSAHMVPGINHKCLRRKSLRTYELLDPTKPGEGVSFDVGQVKEIVQMDKCLREDGVISSVPAGFIEFATRFNQYAVGPERFATYAFVNGRAVIHKDGRPVVWEHFMIDDSLVGWDLDTLEQSASASSTSTMPQLQQDSTLSLDFLENSSNPQLKALSARMKVALKTTDELTKFWIKRGAIEQQYASRLANLAETMIGEHESSDLRSAIDGLRVETAKQAMNRYELAKQIAVELESRCVELHLKQSTHWHDLYEPAARKLHNDQVRESRRRSGVASEWKKEYKKLRYSLDTRRLESMKANLNYRDFSMNSKGGNNFASEFDSPSGSSLDSQRMSAGWIKEWEALRDSCEQLEVDRSQLLKDVLRVFADTLSVIRATDHESIETINLSNDLFRPEDFVEEFCQNFGSRTSAPGTPKARHARVHFPSENLTEESSITPSSTFHSSASFRPLPPPPGTVPPRPLKLINPDPEEEPGLDRQPRLQQYEKGKGNAGPFASIFSSTPRRRPTLGLGINTPVQPIYRVSPRSQDIQPESQNVPQNQQRGRPTLYKISTAVQRTNFL